MKYTTDVNLFGAQQNQATFDALFTPQAVPLLLSPRTHDQLPHLGEPEPWSQALPSVPEEKEATDRGEDPRSVGVKSIRGTTPESHSEQPPTKKQRIQCTACKEEFSAKKSLYRHRETCHEHCAKFDISPKPYRCDECPQKSFSRKDILLRHVQNIHRGQPRRWQQGSGLTTQQSASDAAQESQGSEPQPPTINITTTRPLNVASNAFTGSDSTNCYNNAFQYSDTNDIIASELAAGEHQTKTYPQAFTTPAAALDLQGLDYVAVASNFDCTSDRQSSSSYQMTSISALSNEWTPATPKPSPTSVVHEVAITADCEINDDAEPTSLTTDAALAAAVEQKLTLLDVPYLSATPISQGRDLRPRRIHNPTPCPICGDELGYGPNDNGEVKTHLERHMKRMEDITMDKVKVSDSEAHCADCQIHFLDPRDLVRHQQSVWIDQRCGFTFDHVGRVGCTGHHPPTIGGQANPDHHKFTNFLREWEGLQRRDFEEYVNAYSKGTAVDLYRCCSQERSTCVKLTPTRRPLEPADWASYPRASFGGLSVPCAYVVVRRRDSDVRDLLLIACQGLLPFTGTDLGNTMSQTHDLLELGPSKYRPYIHHTMTTPFSERAELPRRRAFEENFEAYLKGGYGLGRPHCRRSTGFMYSMISLKTISSAFSTPVRFRYGGQNELKSVPVTHNAPPIPAHLIQRLSKAFTDGNLNVVTRICSLHSLHDVPEIDLPLRVNLVNPTWVYADFEIERIRCLRVMVEQGLSIPR